MIPFYRGKDKNVKTEVFSLFRDYEIKCRVYKESDTPHTVVIGVHGFAGDKDSSMLKRLAKAVTKEDGALICFDFPCHGESPVGEDMLTSKNCIDDLVFVCQYAEKEYAAAKKVLFATSYGGYISVLAAGLLTNFTYVLRAPAVTMPRILLETVLKVSRADFEKSGCIKCGFDRKMDLPFSFCLDLEGCPETNDIKIDNPFLVIHGDRDDIVPPEDVLDFCRNQKNACLEIIKGADHRFKNTGEADAVIEKTINFIIQK